MTNKNNEKLAVVGSKKCEESGEIGISKKTPDLSIKINTLQ